MSQRLARAALSPFLTTTASRRYRSTPSSATRPPGFCFDIDGVLKRGSRVLEEGRQALQLVLKHNLPYVLLTNGGGVTEDKRCEALTRELEVEIHPAKLVQSHTPMRALKRQFADARILAVGGAGDNVREVAHSYGFTNVVIPDDLLASNPSIWPFRRLGPQEYDYVQRDLSLEEPFAAVMVFHDTRDYGRDIQIICDILASRDGVVGTEQKRDQRTARQAVPLYFSNPDVLWANDFPVSRFGQGAFQLALHAVYEALTGSQLEATCCGKPHAITFDYAAALLEAMVEKSDRNGSDAITPSGNALPEFSNKVSQPKDVGPRRVYMIGDNPAADVLGANLYRSNGHPWSSLLVQTGVFKGSEKDNAAADQLKRADHVFPNVLHAVQWALEHERVT